MRQFWLKYFTATEKSSWLTCLSAPQRLKMLEELMQWEMTSDS
ncbi:glucose uptake inhibitor SgrT [Citrobacter portucalensis]|nr:glucose uptake inhibitor SgrT [Citrobacter portucalensis]MCX9008656.1 glucose uptake inhibitor SgrT [Citrobacter portucalensis]